MPRCPPATRAIGGAGLLRSRRPAAAGHHLRQGPRLGGGLRHLRDSVRALGSESGKFASFWGGESGGRGEGEWREGGARKEDRVQGREMFRWEARVGILRGLVRVLNSEPLCRLVVEGVLWQGRRLEFEFHQISAGPVSGVYLRVGLRLVYALAVVLVYGWLCCALFVWISDMPFTTNKGFGVGKGGKVSRPGKT